MAEQRALVVILTISTELIPCLPTRAHLNTKSLLRKTHTHTHTHLSTLQVPGKFEKIDSTVSAYLRQWASEVGNLPLDATALDMPPAMRRRSSLAVTPEEGAESTNAPSTGFYAGSEDHAVGGLPTIHEHKKRSAAGRWVRSHVAFDAANAMIRSQVSGQTVSHMGTENPYVEDTHAPPRVSLTFRDVNRFVVLVFCSAVIVFDGKRSSQQVFEITVYSLSHHCACG